MMRYHFESDIAHHALSLWKRYRIMQKANLVITIMMATVRRGEGSK